MIFASVRGAAFLILAGWAWFAPSTALAAPDRLRVQSIRIADDGGQVDLHLTRSAPFKLFTLADPYRVVLDISSAALGPTALPLPHGSGSIRDLRVAHRAGGSLRIVFDMNQPVRPSGTLAREGAQPILTLRLEPVGVFANAPAAAAAPARAAVPPMSPTSTSTPMPAASSLPLTGPRPAPRPPAVRAPTRDVVVAVDAGHGGRDPGARGPSGTLEKDVTLAISRKLVSMLDDEPGMSGVLTRGGDQFVVLRQRMERARSANADLFISIHADAAHNRRARGSTVYVLSEKAASDEAALRLAARENAALIGGVELGNKDPVLASVLMDLSQNASISSSIVVGESILKQMKNLGHLHRSTVQMAPFMVLKSPDVPSILVETAYISNPQDERNLRSAAFQERLAKAILAGVQQYFRNNPPRGTILAATGANAGAGPIEYVIQRGDTLSAIANRYAISVQQLRAANQLRDDRVLVGQTLRIPGDDI